ncbi:hypothetical protein LP416_18635 [Polaromonas sp. P2-4]|nr:hypothetical protein LP416_18635 [Polaromonas sp. P2-4]
MLSGEITPSQLSIVREINTAGAAFDTAMFSDLRANYNIVTDVATGVTTVTHLDPVTGLATGIDGTDRLLNVERLQFSDQTVSLEVVPTNSSPVGLLTLTEVTPGVFTVSAAGVTDADNPGGAITGPISFVWQFQPDPVRAPGVFQDIVAVGGGNPATAHGNTFRVTPDLAGLAIRARAVYQDGAGVLENVFSAATGPVVAAPLRPQWCFQPRVPPPAPATVCI